MIYRWNDEVIQDIHAWARTRGEGMVRFERYRERPNPLTGEMVREVEDDEMPETFFNNLRYGGEEGWLYRVTQIYAP